MDTETKDLLLQHIRNGRYIPDMFFDVRKLFVDGGMALYAKPCCDRIEAAGLVDGVHIFRTVAPPWNLQIDADGMKLCSGILGGYLPMDYIHSIQEIIQGFHNWYTSMNNTLYLLRKADAGALERRDMSVLGYKISPEEEADMAELLRAELRCRKLPYRVLQTAKRVVYVGQLLLHFHGPIELLAPFIRLAWQDWKDNGNGVLKEGTGRYSKALQRFLDAHRGNSGISSLQGDDLVKYVYLAVKAYGKEDKAEINHIKLKSCLEIESRYLELKRTMEAVGRLTPMELMQMYPVTKEYDGERWGSKDYFYTIKKLKAWPVDQPIGDAQDVASLLWDYQNWDLTLLLLQWSDVIGDMYIYCNDKGPHEELHDRLRRKDA